MRTDSENEEWMRVAKALGWAKCELELAKMTKKKINQAKIENLQVESLLQEKVYQESQ